MTNISQQGLTGKQAAFVEHYLGDAHLNASRAARLAGYSGNDNAMATMGWELLRNPKVQASIEAQKAIKSGKATPTESKVLCDLEETRLLALAKGDLSTATRCSELQGKHLAMFTDRQVVDDPARAQVLADREREQAEILAQLWRERLQLPAGEQSQLPDVVSGVAKQVESVARDVEQPPAAGA